MSWQSWSRRCGLPFPFPLVNRGGSFLGSGLGSAALGRDLILNRTDADTVCLSDGPVHRPGLGHSHLGAPDDGRHIGGIGVSIADEAPAFRTPIDCGLERPLGDGGIRESYLWGDVHAVAAPLGGDV